MIDGLADIAARCGTVIERDRVVRAGEGLRGTALLEGRRVKRVGVRLLDVRRHVTASETGEGCYNWATALVLVDGEAHPRWIDAGRLTRMRAHSERGWPSASIDRLERMLRRRV